MKLLIIILIFSFSLFSVEYKVSDQTVEFIHINDKLVSVNCKKGCIALKKRVPKNVFDGFDRNFGKNPSTAACKYVKGEIVRVISKLGHRTYFCKFKDKSYIHSGHLM